VHELHVDDANRRLQLAAAGTLAPTSFRPALTARRAMTSSLARCEGTMLQLHFSPTMATTTTMTAAAR
jgi:hypothetical protein